MNQNHSCLVIKPRATDWVMGDGHITLKANTLGTWLPCIEFFERQLLNFGDTNGCVLFTSQESFDAQIEQQIALGLISPATVQYFTANGYMDSVNSLDGKPHFHSSPRFLQILTGNGLNGNAVQEAWDVMRQYGVLPYTDLPVDSTMTPEQYVDPTAVTQDMKNKALSFLVAVGGKNAIQYQWVTNGTENWQAMVNALLAAPLCLGVNVGNDWNLAAPQPPTTGANPGHCVMGFTVVAPNDMRIYDHYLPNPKDLISYPIWYALQAVVTVTPPPPAPTLPPNVTPTTATPAQTQKWLQALVNWLQGIIGGLGKVETSNKQMQISAFEQAALHVCKVAAWVIGSAAVPALLTLYTGNPYWLALTPFINGIGAGLVKWSGIQNAAAITAAAKTPSAQ